MVWNKRTVGTLITVIVLLLLCAAKCKAEKPQPVVSETYTDENGTVYTYKQYDTQAAQALDTKSYALIMAAGVAVLAIAGNFMRRTARLSALKGRCTASVPAVVTAVRRGKTDAQIRHRRTVYNAAYRYEYSGTTFESNNYCYGTAKSSFSEPVRVGDTQEIRINPANPDELFDFLAESSLRHSRFLGIFLSASGILLLLALLFR